MAAQTGRPREHESRRRTSEFLRLLAGGAMPHDAARQAGVKPERALRLLGDPVFRRAFCELLDAAA
jgi:hypothetical protein